MFSFLYIAIARRLSASATCCGVVTTIAPATGTVWLKLNATSPVPGGKNIRIDHEVIEVSHATSRKNCCSAPCSIGPRQMIGASSCVRKPSNDFQSVLLGGDDLLSVGRELAFMPSMIGTFGP